MQRTTKYLSALAMLGLALLLQSCEARIERKNKQTAARTAQASRSIH
jgi:hypothetical protein